MATSTAEPRAPVPPRLRWAPIRFLARAETHLRIPDFSGSALRGGFGRAFRRLSCAEGDRGCGGAHCRLRDLCPYGRIFETPVPDGVDPGRFGGDQAPRPFVLRPPLGRRTLPPASEFEFGVILVGRAVDDLPYFIFTLTQLGRSGFGPGRGRFSLVEARDADEKCVYHADGHRYTAPAVRSSDDVDRTAPTGTVLEVRFLSPVRIQRQGEILSELPFSRLVLAIARRLQLLSAFHSGDVLPPEPLTRDLLDLAHTVTPAGGTTRRAALRRYSSRQRRPLAMDGQVGTLRYQGPWQPFWPLLAIGADLHVGKATAFGLGRFEIGVH